MMIHMHQNLFAAAAARLIPWGGLLRRLPLARTLPLALASNRATARSPMEPASCTWPMASPARASRLDSVRHATLSAAPRQARAMLRVVRIVETDQASASSGRIVMCGRMADVCAELDRMVEREAAQLART